LWSFAAGETVGEEQKLIGVSIIVPVFNAADTLGACLESLVQQDIRPEGYEVIVVDNNSSDGSMGIARRYQSVRVLRERRQSAYAARNRGLRAATGRFIAFTDADCVARRDWLVRLRERINEPHTFVVMGRDRPAGRSKAIRLLAEYDHYKEMFVMAHTDPAVYYGHTNNLMARREVFEHVGLFDERPRGADVILVQRVVASYGSSAVQYEPSAVVDHLELSSSRVYFKKAFIYGGSARAYCRIVPARPLHMKERLRIFSTTARAAALSKTEAGHLFVLLIIGVLAYGLGWLLAVTNVTPSNRPRPDSKAQT
jgi:glycosyltransferase involved in cell wall biosynthesis